MRPHTARVGISILLSGGHCYLSHLTILSILCVHKWPKTSFTYSPAKAIHLLNGD